MPIRGRISGPPITGESILKEEATTTTFDPGVIFEDEIENLRLGTREQYESDWTFIEDTGNHNFDHELGEIPMVVDVMVSEVSEGRNPDDAASSTTITKNTTQINITNNVGADRYFKVRAM